GSVKKWGVRRRSRGVSAAPENRQEVAISPDSQTHPTSQPTSPDEPHHDRGKTSRPQSSRSSNAHMHSQRNSISINPSASGSPSSNNWFFRGGSSSKHAPSDDRVSHGSPSVTVHRSGSVGGASHRSRSRSRTGSRGGTARDGIGKVASPLNLTIDGGFDVGEGGKVRDHAGKSQDLECVFCELVPVCLQCEIDSGVERFQEIFAVLKFRVENLLK
ncbi:hypothetical protein BJ165DRAFT_1568635, partial [Panaeolus papilionaceus]